MRSILPLLVLLSAIAPFGGCKDTTAAEAGATSDNPKITFNRDVAPIILENCAGCHRPGEVGPFSLLTYQDVSRRAQQVAVVTQTRFMPPWLPEPGKGEFDGDRRLSDSQVSVIQ